MTTADYIKRGEGPCDGKRGSQRPTLGIHFGAPVCHLGSGDTIPDNNDGCSFLVLTITYSSKPPN